MKKILIPLFTFFAILVSCDKLEQLQEGLTFDDANKALLTQTVPATATSAQSIRFKAADVWIAEVKDAAWLTVTPGYGGAGDYTLQFKLEMNTAEQPRTGKVVLTCKSKTTDITITQEAMPEMTIDEANKALLTQMVQATATSAQSITFSAPLSWTATVKDAPWLKVSPARGDAGTATLAFTLEANGTFQARTGKVEITCNGKTLEATITQEGLTEWEAPMAMAYVKTIGMQYVENVETPAVFDDRIYTLSYDSKKRVSSIAYSGQTMTYDYSKPGVIVGTKGNLVCTYRLGSDGLVDSMSAPEEGNVVAMTYSVVRSEGNIVQLIGKYDGERHGEEVIGVEYTAGKWTAFVMPDGSHVYAPEYRFNQALPNININLNAFLWVGTDYASAQVSPLWLGYCGKLGDYLIERPLFSYKESMSSSSDTYTYGHLGDITDLKVEKDNNGCFTKITYDWQVDEWKYSNGSREKTGKKLGTNQIVYSISYL